MPITINGSGTITGVNVGGLPDGIVDTDMIANNAVTSAKSTITGGKILQVQSAVLTTAFTTGSMTSGQNYDILTCDITPSAATSKILIQWFISQLAVTGGTDQVGMYLRRDTTGIGFPTSVGSRRSFTAFFSAWDNQHADRTKGNSGCWVDSPNSTSAITYRLTGYDGDGSGNIFINRSVDDTDNTTHARTPSQLILMEVAA